jgi:lysophospholipid acyltransferase (LPLAT)-like uncharacterized protein
MRKLLVWLSAALIRLLASTLRMRVEDHAGIFHRPDHPPMILAFWHNRVGLLSYFHERYKPERTLYAFISLSRDGQFIAEIAERFGVKAVRGSSSRKGTRAALNAVRAARDAHSDVAISPDGPRGPRYQIQPGLLRLAQATRRPIVTVTYHLSWKYVLRSTWDHFQVPLPFSVCTLVTRGPIAVPEHASDQELDAINAIVAEALGSD